MSTSGTKKAVLDGADSCVVAVACSRVLMWQLTGNMLPAQYGGAMADGSKH